VRRAIAVSVEHLLRHDIVMRLDADPEGVHRARVATRRLRSDLRSFRSLLDPAWTADLREELKWFGSVLGETRDADVMLERIRHRAETQPAADAPGAAEVVDALIQRRKEAHAALIETLRGARYVDLLERLVAAANEPALLLSADLPAAQVLPELIRGPWKSLRRNVKQAGSEPDASGLHAIRIRTKRVRYAADAVAPLMGKPARRFAEAAADLQTLLGHHNDAVVAESWLRAWAVADGRSRDATFAAGVLAGIERAVAGEARGAWRKSWKRLRQPANREWMA
jgi:CHAD domain-containing protein